MSEAVARVVEELLEDADDGRLDPLRSVYVERQGELVEYLQADEYEGWHLRSTIGAVRQRVLADGTVVDVFTDPGDFATPDAWIYLPAPIDWPTCSRSELAGWMAEHIAAAL
jgi:hypothetical protein